MKSFLSFSLTPQVQWVRQQRCTRHPTWVCGAAGRSKASARCTATPPAARWPQRETWWPGAAGCWSLSWRMPLSGNEHKPDRVRLEGSRQCMRAIRTLRSFCRRQVNWREAKGEEEINIYQSERRRRTIHSLPKESRVSGCYVLVSYCCSTGIQLPTTLKISC